MLSIDEDSRPDRLALALSLIADGHVVNFPGFSLSMQSGELCVSVPYSPSVRDDSAALKVVALAERNLDFLLSSGPTFMSLASLPRSISLVHYWGKGGVCVAEVRDGNICWQGI